MTGPRVVAPDNRIIALWDPLLRYRASKAGYHGGASLAEITIPMLAFLLPHVTDVPDGWSAVEVRRPQWWQSTVASANRPELRSPAPKPRRRPAAPAGEALFEIPEAPSTPATRTDRPELVDRLKQSELFAAQQALTPRRLDAKKIEAALRALLEAKGILPAAVLAERAGEIPARATGFVSTLQRIFNVDNYPVLTLIDDGRTVRLDIRMLIDQFRLSGEPS